MTRIPHGAFARHWREIASGFLKLGATSYGGPAIMGIMQAELQDKRQWVSKERFVEGLSLVNILPGAGATQLGIFLGHARGGWWGGVLAGLCFVLPAFGIMLALTMTYASLGATPLMRGGLYGLGPVVLGIFTVAVYRLGRSAVTTISQIMLVIAAAAAIFLPSFILVLSVLPMFERVRTLVWAKAAMKGVGPAVIGVLAVSLVQMAPHALPDPFAVAMLMGTLIVLLSWRISAIKLMMAGAVLGVLRSRLLALPGVRAVLGHLGTFLKMN